MRLPTMTNPDSINMAKALSRVTKPSCVMSPGNPGTASHNSKSTDKNTANAAKINNRAILIIKMATGQIQDYCLLL